MTRISVLILTLLVASLSLAQSLMIYTNDPVPLKFEISAIDSLTISTVSLAKQPGSSSWATYTIDQTTTAALPEPSLVTQTVAGWQLNGSDNRISQAIYRATVFENHLARRTVYLKWKVLGKPGDDASFSIDLNSAVDIKSSACQVAKFNSDSGANSIACDTWYFSRMVVEDGQVTVTTCSDNYDNCSGTIHWTSWSELPEAVATFSLEFHAPRTAYLLIGELKLE